MKKQHSNAASMQLGFDELLADTDRLNERAAFETKHGHLPATMEEALPFYGELIARHHMAMLDGDLSGAMLLREEAHNLALRLNNGEPSILAGPDAPGSMLERLSTRRKGRCLSGDNAAASIWSCRRSECASRWTAYSGSARAPPHG